MISGSQEQGSAAFLSFMQLSIKCLLAFVQVICHLRVGGAARKLPLNVGDVSLK